MTDENVTGSPQVSARGHISGVGGEQPVTGERTYTYNLSDEAPRIPAGRLVAVGEEFERKIRGRQEWVRTALAVGAFLSLVVVLVLLLGAVYGQITADNVEKIATVVVTPLTGIVGTIIGFYFAERRPSGS